VTIEICLNVVVPSLTTNQGKHVVNSHHENVVFCILRFRMLMWYNFNLRPLYTKLWPCKSRGRGIEWPNFVESPKKWVENIQLIKYSKWSLRPGIV
jgi:hypothetical protein